LEATDPGRRSELSFDRKKKEEGEKEWVQTKKRSRFLASRGQKRIGSAEGEQTLARSEAIAFGSTSNGKPERATKKNKRKVARKIKV